MVGAVKIWPTGFVLELVGDEWFVSFGRYQGRMRACRCDLPPCTCKRQPARTWARPGSHERTHCHAGHVEHVAKWITGIRKATKRESIKS